MKILVVTGQDYKKCNTASINASMTRELTLPQMIQTNRNRLSATVFYKASNDLLKLLLGSGAEKTKEI